MTPNSLPFPLDKNLCQGARSQASPLNPGLSVATLEG